MVRKTAAHRLLQGCEIRWNCARPEDGVHKFVENSITDHWSISKLQILMVLLSELRRLYKQGRAPEIRARFGTVISGENLGYLLSLV